FSLQRFVGIEKAHGWEKRLSRRGIYPVRLLACRRLGAEVDVYRAIGPAKATSPAKALPSMVGPGYWPLPEIVKDTLLPGRQLDDERPILTKVDIAHGIDHVRVGRGDQRLCIQALLPHWQDVVASTKARL